MKAAPSTDDVTIDGSVIVSSNPAVQYDLGAFAKGYAVDRGIELLRSLGISNAIINAGGDLCTIGRRGNRSWRIGIRSPRQTSVLASVARRMMKAYSFRGRDTRDQAEQATDMTRADWLLLAFVITGLPLLYARLWFPASPATWLQYQSGYKPSEAEPLSPDRQLSVKGQLGNSVIEISGGMARFISSPCTGKVCIHTGWLRQSGDMAACLPNHVTIQLHSAHPRYDALNF